MTAAIAAGLATRERMPSRNSPSIPPLKMLAISHQTSSALRTLIIASATPIASTPQSRVELRRTMSDCACPLAGEGSAGRRRKGSAWPCCSALNPSTPCRCDTRGGRQSARDPRDRVRGNAAWIGRRLPPMGRAPRGTMTNATVAETVKDVEGQVVIVKYKGGEKRVVIPPDARILAYAAG